MYKKRKIEKKKGEVWFLADVDLELCKILSIVSACLVLQWGG